LPKETPGVQRGSSPANPEAPGNDQPLFSDAPRHLTTNQKRLLTSRPDELRGLRFPITYLASDNETYGFAQDLRATLALAGVEIGGPNEQYMGNAVGGGLFIEVKDKSAPPDEALRLQRALEVADLHSQIIDFPADQKGYPYILFVGPRPIQR
jgi:hypothetical protein